MIGSKVNDILIFMSVVETGSFVAGGKAFGLSRSTAGKAVARLEEGYGARLLNRTTRALDLTDEGRHLYEHGQGIRAAIEAADTSVMGKPGIPRGLLRITAPDAIGRRLILPVVSRYLDLWPETQVEMSFSDRIDNLVETGFDLAIRIGTGLPDRSFIARRILRDEPVLCAAPSYFQNRDRPATLEQLCLHDLLQFSSSGDRQGWRLKDENGDWVRAQGHIRLRMDSAEALCEAVIAGQGIALLPRILIADEMAAGHVEHILPQTNCGELFITALYPHKRLLEPRVRHFIDLLAAQYRGYRQASSI